MSSENFRAILVQHGSKEGNNYINNISQIIQFLPSLSGETYKNHLHYRWTRSLYRSSR
jgi:hypothetical protein